MLADAIETNAATVFHKAIASPDASTRLWSDMLGKAYWAGPAIISVKRNANDKVRPSSMTPQVRVQLWGAVSGSWSIYQDTTYQESIRVPGLVLYVTKWNRGKDRREKTWVSGELPSIHVTLLYLPERYSARLMQQCEEVDSVLQSSPLRLELRKGRRPKWTTIQFFRSSVDRWTEIGWVVTHENHEYERTLLRLREVIEQEASEAKAIEPANVESMTLTFDTFPERMIDAL